MKRKEDSIMKTMKTSMKCLIAMFVMIMAFALTGITAQAAVTGLKQTSDSTSSVRVEWGAVSGAKWYGYQIATDKNFTKIIKEYYTTLYSATFPGLTEGSTYYVRVGYGPAYNDCYKNWSVPLEVVTQPGAITVKFIDATDTTATIQYSAAGANRYSIYKDDKTSLVGTTTSGTYTIKNLNNTMKDFYYVAGERVSSAGYVASTTQKYVYINLLTTKIAKKDFCITDILEYTNKIMVTALYSGSGFEVEVVNAGGSKYSTKQTSTKSYKANGSQAGYFSYKPNKFLKYRVRAYVNTDAGIKYGQWSDYRAFCEIDNAKYTYGSRKITYKWSKVNGTGKFKVQVSKKEKKGYKTFKTLKGSAKSVTINKYGKSALTKNKTYYFRITPMVKINGKYVASDGYLYNKIKIR